ncbi:cofactor-independent phosphoglycerate mutase [Seleniivibrio woodruffii]|uniref:cofactor-independent phosphoglycerate mutase n=1 Tax=Seleniivibrio woodruffii TaxID=1078050 RepID=UPI0026F375C4|nr:cofactor-independent phosphoglycerate mutase [Seleniivibrio woodruffii]
MKYVVLLTDGMSDHKIEELGGKTVMQAADKPNMDRMAKEGVGGFIKSTPDGYYPGSDICNLSLMGYDPTVYYSGRSPLEAGSQGIELNKGDMAFRCNLVTLDGKVMDDFSAHHIDGNVAKACIAELDSIFRSEGAEFYPGVGYRNLMIMRNVDFELQTTPPHDIMGQEWEQYLPKGKGADTLLSIMERAKKVFDGGKYARANSIWFWGEGVKPEMPSFKELYGLNGAVVAAVDLIRGIGRFGGLEIINVPGATGFIDTNFEGKAEYALKSLEKNDYVFIHVEAPDEAGHMGSISEKIKAVENIDSRLLPILLDGLKKFGDFRIMVSPDHPTPVKRRTHVAEPVPCIIYGTGVKPDENQTYDEFMKPTFFIENGFRIAEFFLKSPVING